MALTEGAERSRSRSPRKSPEIDGDDEAATCGYSARDLFLNPNNKTGFTYDDIILLPGQINFDIGDVELETQFSRRITLKAPIVSSPMDTVTESRMAIAIALHGGIGVIHRKMDIEAQVGEVVKVKKYKNGFITDPKCLSPTMKMSEYLQLRASAGFNGFPVTSDGKMGSTLVGLVTRRDTDFMEHEGHLLVSEFMTPFDKLFTAPENVSLEEAYQLVAKSKKSKLPIISEDRRLVALVSQTDLKKRNDFPLATKSANKSLRVAAAVGTHPSEQGRVRALAIAGVDAVVIDQKQGDTSEQADMIRWIKKEVPEIDVIGGNVVTRMQAKHLVDAGADGLRVGMGVGSVSRAQDVAACGRAQASAVFHTSLIAREAGIPIIADGGIGSPGHIIKSLCMGASVAMCGSLLAGCEESPGDYFFSETGMRLKAIRGNQSLETLNRSSSEKDQGRMKRSGAQIMVAQGVSGTVQDKGSMFSYLPYLMQSLKHGLQDIGMQSVTKLHNNLHSFQLRFELRSAAAQKEGGVHGLHSFERKLYA